VDHHFHPAVRVLRDEERCDYRFCRCFGDTGNWQKTEIENGDIMQALIFKGKTMTTEPAPAIQTVG
jgi:hypothetical protein